MRDQLLKQAKRVVIKIGTSLVASRGAGLRPDRIERLADEISAVAKGGREVLLVSSGAIVSGIQKLGLKSYPKSLPLKQAAAAVGQSRLMWAYEKAFERAGQKVAQILLTHQDLADRRRFLNARHTLTALLEFGVIPIINENDTVAADEIRFGDNDTLAAMVTNLIEAHALIIFTDQAGLYNRDPRNDPAATLIPEVSANDPGLEAMAGGVGSSIALGGMLTKVLAARRAARSGAHTVVASGHEKDALVRLARGERLGTRFIADQPTLAARKQWLADHLQVRGSVVLDAGAVKALAAQGKSLLPIGVIEVRGEFERGEVVSCVDESRREIARGLVNYSSAETRKILRAPSAEIEARLGYVDEPELIHRDNLVLL